MSLVKHGHSVLLAGREDDPSVAGGVDNAIILYRAIEKDAMTVLRTDDINRLARESDKER
ncbi:hypothetical protein X777_11395 [Ooceraea biroi]|uniref:Uncharacterized protein n=1 Tax=Ooceraea biroi TaxID=2015173 RepID=A0A026W1G8_OOCBI|nr:hypothetical protein X777_11395 [Ooceraea biroi]